MNRQQRRLLASKTRVAPDPLAMGDQHFADGRLSEAELLYKTVLRADPLNFHALHQLGLINNRLGRAEEAAELIARAIELDSGNPAAYANLGMVLLALGRLDEAQAACKAAISLNPSLINAYKNLGVILANKGELEGALASYHQAINLDPGPPDVTLLASIGDLLENLKRMDEAIISRKMVMMVVPTSAEAVSRLGETLYRAGNSSEAFAAFRTALDLDPCWTRAAVDLCWKQRFACEWQTLELDDKRILGLCRDGTGVSPPHPFALLTLPMGLQNRLEIARAWSEQYRVPPQEKLHALTWKRQAVHRDRIRVGYLSSDYKNHATAYLISELIERHDRSRFEIIGYSTGPDDKSPSRDRLVKAFDKFIDLRNTSDRSAARIIYDDQLDILVDLKGHTQDARTQILAWRPCGIQVNYLGYPGTMGAEFIDYIIGDSVVIPAEHCAYYSEKVAYLPGSYQPNDSKRSISKTPDRAECGLPAEGFVFCCFNDSYKLTPTFFDIWMRLLLAVPGSVLWLIDANPQAKANLRNEAAYRGVDPDRLVFAPKIGVSDHLARHRLADLFLDTLPVNAHTTASDALWAELPVVTCLGDEFHGRVAASLLNAIGMEELITNSLEEYEALALKLATDTEELSRIKQGLIRNRLTTPLFDIVTYTKNLERLYLDMIASQAADIANV